jgi:LPS sulfotransferase NodH
LSQSSPLPAKGHVSLASDALQQLARQRLADAEGEVSFRFLDALESLAGSLDDEARLSPSGRLSRQAELIERLVIQGRLQQQLERHPEIADLPIRSPVIIVALPRTGTTLLHNLLAQHSRLRGPALWELMYPVDPAGGPGSTYQHLRDETARQRDWLAQHAAAAVAAHYQDADRPDECRHLMERAFRSFVDMMGSRVPRFERWLICSDMAEPYAYHRLQLQHIVWRIPAERLVLKDMLHLYFLPEVLREYPDAKIIILHRNPLELVPSAISLALAYRPLSSTAIDLAEESRRWLDRLADGVERMMRARPSLPAGQILDIAYPRLVAQPMDVLAEIAEFADNPLTRRDEQRMSTYLADNPQNKHGVHRYNLEQFELAPDDIERRFADYRAAFGV